MIGENLEKYTFEYLITRALSKVPETIDKREGSIIYDALAPACYELAEFYMELKRVLNDVFISTATGEYLDNRVLEQGLTRYPATNAVRKGVFTFINENSTIPVGSRFSTREGQNSINFTVSDYIGPHVNEEGITVPNTFEYELTCEELGTIGNEYSGELLPITNIPNITLAILTSIITPAQNVETDDELRARYLYSVKQKPFGGNVAQYIEELKGINGVGEVQIYPVWNGGGTVKCSVISREYIAISDEFKSQIQEIIDPTPQGTGVGIAPIGHTVTITTPNEVQIDVSVKVSPKPGNILETLKEHIKESIENYFLELRTLWGTQDEAGVYNLSVYLSQINYAILSVPGVANVTNVKIKRNNTSSFVTEDIMLTENKTTQELPFLGTITYE